MSKSVLFSLLAVGCIYLILDNFYGKKLVDKLAKKLTNNNEEYVLNEEEKIVDTKAMDSLAGDAEKAGEVTDNLYDELTADEKLLVIGGELRDNATDMQNYLDSIQSEKLYLGYLQGNIPSSVKDGATWVK